MTHNYEPIILIGGIADGEKTMIDKEINEIIIPRDRGLYIREAGKWQPLFGQTKYRRTEKLNSNGLRIFECENDPNPPSTLRAPLDTTPS